MWKYVYSANSKLHTTEQLAGGYFARETYNNIFTRESPFSKKSQIREIKYMLTWLILIEQKWKILGRKWKTNKIISFETKFSWKLSLKMYGLRITFAKAKLWSWKFHSTFSTNFYLQNSLLLINALLSS